MIEIILKLEFMRIIGKKWSEDISFKCTINKLGQAKTGRGKKLVGIHVATGLEERVSKYLGGTWLYSIHSPRTGTNFTDFANETYHKFTVKSPIRLDAHKTGITQT